MNAKKIVPLVISLVSALLVLFVALKFVSSKTSLTSVVQKHPQVVFAKTPIPAGSVINEEELVMGDLAIEAPPETVFHNPGELIGRVPSVPLMPGQIITATTLTAKGTGPGLASLTPLGMRAVTLDINEITGVAGNIVPGCHIDIMQTMRNDKTGQPMTRLIAQDVKVAATGMPHGDAGDGGGRSITVFATPEQAMLLELAAMSGRARMVLRGYHDDIRADYAPVDFALLQGNKPGSKQDPLAVNPVVALTTQPSANAPATRPSEETWDIKIVRSGAESTSTFKLHNEKGLEDTDANVSTDPITPESGNK